MPNLDKKDSINLDKLSLQTSEHESQPPKSIALEGNSSSPHLGIVKQKTIDHNDINFNFGEDTQKKDSM